MSEQKLKIRDQLLSEKNIFLAIYLVNSYIQNRDLLSKDDQEELIKLKRIFNTENIKKNMKKIHERLCQILDDKTDFFQITVYFKPKKYQEGKTIFRPLHTASLIDQIAMIAMLQVLVYDFNQREKLLPSELSRQLPSNFYGNIVSYDSKQLFVPWQEQYQKYTTTANEFLSKYSETKEYKYEVNLDLKNFFPSINPKILYRLIYNKLPLSWKDDLTVQTILEKLMVFKLCKLDQKEISWYLNKEESAFSDCCNYAKGLPQGLPHTYFLANLYMLLVKKQYEKIFPGEMVFYVDDSVIFTNGLNNFLNETEFKDCIAKLNENIFIKEKQLLNSNNYTLQLPKDYTYQDDDFGISVHEELKSTFSTIPDAKENSGEIYLHGLSRETSNINFDMHTIFSENEIPMLLSRTRSIVKIISNELERINTLENQETYKEKLLRYQKFFKYRETILSYQEGGDIENLYNKVIKDITLRKDSDYIKSFHEKYTDDILASSIHFVLRRCAEDCSSNEDLINAVKSLAEHIHDNHTKHSYLQKTCECYQDNKLNYYSSNLYEDILPELSSRFYSARKQKNELKWKKFKGLLEKNKENLFKDMFPYLFDCSKYIQAKSDVLTRILLNAVFSYIFEYDLTDQFSFAKQGRQPIQYAQIRVLSALRNSQFSFEDFIKKYPNYTQDEFCCVADYSLLQVMHIFKTFVGKIDLIDQLILTHKYCCDTWKNGSKHLYFYTLHNQEHAVTLIHRSIEWIRAISYFKLKQQDYFILFAACYLHDISMVSLPHTDKFYIGKSLEAKQIYTDLKLQLDSNKTENKLHALYNAYEKIDGFFENDIRNNHAINSGKEIRKFPELCFLNPEMREFIARVSEAHGYDTSDIYTVKSIGQESLINEKFIKIILRLSDLADMNRYRISNIILNHNLANLNEISRFHWISHLITDSCQISVNYNPTNNTSESESFLRQGAIVENLELTVNVLMSQTTTVKKRHCKYVSTIKNEINRQDTPRIIIACDQKGCCEEHECMFLCKWFTIKNGYLLKEFAALKKYLNSISDNFFSSEVKININVIANTEISGKVFDYLREYVENKE